MRETQCPVAVIYKSNTIFQNRMQEDSAHKSNTDTFSELEVTCNTFTGVYSIRLRSLRLKSNFAVCKEILTVQAFHLRL